MGRRRWKEPKSWRDEVGSLVVQGWWVRMGSRGLTNRRASYGQGWPAARFLCTPTFSLIRQLHCICSNAPFHPPEWTLNYLIHGVASIANNTSTRGLQTIHNATLATSLNPQPNSCTAHPISDSQPECKCDPTIPRLLWLPSRIRTQPRPFADRRVLATLITTTSQRVNG